MRFADNRSPHIVTVFKLFSHNWTVSILFPKRVDVLQQRTPG